MWQPSTYYPDPAFQVLNPKFKKYLETLGAVERLGIFTRRTNALPGRLQIGAQPNSRLRCSRRWKKAGKAQDLDRRRRRNTWPPASLSMQFM
jgi:hypothetical protein